MAVGQVAQMPTRRKDLRPFPEELFQIIDLSRRENDIVLVRQEADLFLVGKIILDAPETRLFNQIVALQARNAMRSSAFK